MDRSWRLTYQAAALIHTDIRKNVTCEGPGGRLYLIGMWVYEGNSTGQNGVER